MHNILKSLWFSQVPNKLIQNLTKIQTLSKYSRLWRISPAADKFTPFTDIISGPHISSPADKPTHEKALLMAVTWLDRNTKSFSHCLYL